MTLVKNTAMKAREEEEKDDGMTAQICEALISFSNSNNPLKANGGQKNDAMVLSVKLRAIIKNHEIADIS